MAIYRRDKLMMAADLTPTIITSEYKSTDVDEAGTASVKTVVGNYVRSLNASGSANLEEIRGNVHAVTQYVMENLPNGVTSVDGKVIRPILNQVVDAAIKALPKPVEQPEVLGV